jgi:CubicO group peptidase (beta-lactamase class C family)
MVIGEGTAHGAKADALGDIVAAFDGQRAALGVLSISVALVEGGRINLVQRGVKRASTGAPVGPDTRYQAASMSKTVAAITALSLSIAGRISLDQDVAQYLKRWQLPTLPPGSTKPVTLRRLFGMTAGCNVPGYPGYLVGQPLPDDVQILQGVSPSNMPGVIIERAPGTARAYSGGGCQVAQVVLEDATGECFAMLVEQNVLRPLEMEHSAFWQPPTASQVSELAAGHFQDGREIIGDWNVYPEHAAAGLWSTPADLAQLIVAMSKAAKGHSSTVFAARGLDELLTNVDGLGYGLGTALAGSGRDRIAMKRGNNAGFRGGLVACPSTGQGAVVMTNGNNGQVIIDGVLDALARHYQWPAHAPWPES